MKYILYARKSTEDKDRQIQSIPNQVKVLTDVSKQRDGIEVVDIVTDQKSAKAPGRPGFTRMMQRIEKGEVQGILCWSMDRLTRNPVDGGRVMWLLQQGVIEAIVTPDHTYYPSDSSTVISVETGRSTDYIRRLSKDVRRGMEHKVENGWMPRAAPIGYCNEINAAKGAKRILPDKKLFPIIQHLWQKILKDRCTMMELYNYMRSSCPIYRDGHLISFSSFYRIFKNPFYTGVFQWRKEWHPGKHKPMLTQKEFKMAQEILEGRTKLRQKTLQFDFKGLFRCGCCGAVITAEEHQKTVKKTGEAKSYRYYRCGHRKARLTCREKPMAEWRIEEFVLQELEHMSLPPEVFELGLSELRAERADLSAETVKEQQLSAEIQALGKRITLMRKNMAEEPDASIRADIKREINAAAIQCSGLQQELSKERERKSNPHQEVTSILELIAGAKLKFSEGTSEERRNIIRGLGSNWEISLQNLHYKPHFVSLALKEVKKKHKRELARFEPKQSGIQTTKKLPQELAVSVWSG